MAGREILLDRLPRLDKKSADERAGIRRRRYDRFVPKDEQPSWIETPSLELLSRLARRETVLHRPNEKVGAYSKEWDHTQPARIGNSAVLIKTNHGEGWLPFESSLQLSLKDAEAYENYRKHLSGIKEVYFVQHGVMRNAKDYHKYFMDALGKEYDPQTMLVISPQFPAPVDLKNLKERSWEDMRPDHFFKKTPYGFKVPEIWDKIHPDKVLRWRYNDWRGAEPALNSDAPIDSFTAMDGLVKTVLDIAPNINTIEFRGNSEGGQFLDRYLAFSKTLNEIEFRGESPIKINAIVSNPGTVLYFDPSRPLFDKAGNIIGWNDEYTFDSRENMWPFGLYDAPPYILESVADWPPKNHEMYPNMDAYDNPYDFALANYLRRTILAIGEDDNVPGGFHLPKGPGPAYAAQGNTRYRRMEGKFESIRNLFKRKSASGITFPNVRWKILQGVEHDAKEVFLVTEPYEQFAKTAEIYTGRSLDIVG